MSTATDSKPNSNTPIASTTTVRLTLDSKLFEAYAVQAAESGQDPEEVMLRRLTEFRDQDTFKGRKILVSPTDRQSIEKLFSRSFKDGSELARFLTNVFSMRVDDVDVAVSGQILQRLKDRCGPRRDFAEFVRETVQKQLEHYVGMR